MHEKDLIAFLKEEESSAVGYDRGEVETEQDEALRVYRGEPYGDEEEGRSQIVTRDAAEVVDWMVPDVVRVFASSEKAIVFSPRTEEDSEIADLITDYVRYTFWNDNPGFDIIHDFAFDGLVQKNGFIKVWWEEKPVFEEYKHEGLSVLQVRIFENDQDVEIFELEEEQIDDPDPALTEAYPDGKKYKATIRRTGTEGAIRYRAIPPSEMLYSARARTLQESDYVAIRTAKTGRQIVAEGLLSKKELKDVPKADLDGADSQERRDVLYDYQENNEQKDSERYWVLEEYVRVDFDGDGYPERRRIIRVGSHIVENDVWDGVDIATWSPKRMPHRVTGVSYVDDVKDIQRVNTVVTRQMLDNLYLTNNPKKVVNVSALNQHTINDLLDDRIGGVIRVNGSINDAIRNEVVPFVAGDSFNLLEFMEERKQQRTGVTRLTQGIPENALNETAAVPLKMMAKAESRKELILRNLGNGLSDVFRTALKILKKHQDFERVVRLTGRWVSIDPSAWKSEFDTVVRVGLGNGNADQKAQGLSVILQNQIRALESGSGLADQGTVYNTLAELVEALGLSTVNNYFINPDSEGFQPPEAQPSDAELKAQAEIEKEKMRGQVELQKIEKRLEADIEIEKMKMQLKRFELETEAELTAFKAGVDDDRQDRFSNTNLRNDDG